MLQGRGVRALWGTGVLLTAVWACETARNPSGIQRDLTPPTISLTKTPPDTQDISAGLTFAVSATDNLGLKDIRLTYTGGYIALTDTVFTSTVTASAIPVHITFPSNSNAGGLIRIVGRATDGAGNSAEDTLFIVLNNVKALKVTLIAPLTGAVAGTGKYVPIHVRAVQVSGVKRIGWIVTPGQTATTGVDSLLSAAPPYPDSIDLIDSVLVTGTSGFFVLQGFAVDAGNLSANTLQVTINILSVVNDVTPPQVEHFVPLRAEVGDSITVHATDPSGISKIGFIVTDLTGATVLAADSIGLPPLPPPNLSGNATDVVHTFSMKIPGITTFPTQVVVHGFAVDGAVAFNRGVSGATFTTISPSGPAKLDTITLVAGVTRSFPLGGKIADAIFNANLNELYLTNPSRHRVEIFQVANSSFVANPISFGVGVPWGIALWPRDTLGAYGDTIVVADAGGTQLAIVDVRPAVRRLQWRQDLPNYLIETYRILTSQGGGTLEQITIYDVSDRPQYVATVCRPAAGTACPPDQIYALYSTTPTVSSTSPFAGKGTLRMEKLVSPTSGFPQFGKFFWEIGATTANAGTDTLRIEQIRGQTSTVVLSACAGVSIKLESFGLGDSTYARNSGNFKHAFFGEGGNITTSFARVMAYDANRILQTGVFQSCIGNGRTALASGFNDVDFGMSPGVNVSDFISNTGIHVASVATNFNGLTNVVRADSIYYLDSNLRLKATSCTLAVGGVGCVTGSPGMDMNYFHDFSPGGSCTPTCGGGTNVNNRLLFAARPDASIDVFDTFDGSQILSGGLPVTIPIRDPIIGPLRVAKDATGQLLFGITAKGLVMVRLPALVNPNPAPPRR